MISKHSFKVSLKSKHGKDQLILASVYQNVTVKFHKALVFFFNSTHGNNLSLK